MNSARFVHVLTHRSRVSASQAQARRDHRLPERLLPREHRCRFDWAGGVTETKKAKTERTYRILDDKIKELDTKLPRLKAQIREFFELSTSVKAVFLQIDDFYHLNR